MLIRFSLYLPSLLFSFSVRIIHLVRMRDFPKNKHFLPSDSHRYPIDTGRT